MNKSFLNQFAIILLDSITKQYTAFNSFEELVSAVNYRPSLRCETGLSNNRITAAEQRIEIKILADAYDEYMQSIGVEKKAYRC